MTFFIQDETSRVQLKGVESVSPSFENTEWTTEDGFDIESGDTIAKKTVKNQTDFTVTMIDINQSANEGFAMAKMYADEEGDKEQVYLIAKTDSGEEMAIKGCISSLTAGDYNNALRKPSFVLKGNKCAEVPEDPSLGG